MQYVHAFWKLELCDSEMVKYKVTIKSHLYIIFEIIITPINWKKIKELFNLAVLVNGICATLDVKWKCLLLMKIGLQEQIPSINPVHLHRAFKASLLG